MISAATKIQELSGFLARIAGRVQLKTARACRPFLVYANIGDENNLMPVKQFATREEADAWMGMQKGRTAWVL